MKVIRWIFRTLILLLIGAVLGVYLVSRIPTLNDIFVHGEGTVQGKTMIAVMRNTAEVATQEDDVVCRANYDEEGLKLFDTGITIPLTGKHYQVKYTGRVKAGVKDASKIDVSVNNQKRTVEVTVPKSQILSTEIEPSSIELIDQTHNIINQLEVTDVTKMEAKEEKRIEKNAVRRGILKKADRQMRKIMKNQAEALAGDGYTVTVETA